MNFVFFKYMNNLKDKRMGGKICIIGDGRVSKGCAVFDEYGGVSGRRYRGLAGSSLGAETEPTRTLLK